MMFWKFDKNSQRNQQPAQETPRIDPAAYAAAMFSNDPPRQPEPQQVTPVPIPPALEKQDATASAFSYEGAARGYERQSALALDVPTDYEQGARNTMRFLAEELGIPVWVLLRNHRGVLSVVEGFGDYHRYIANSAFPIARLPELPTINLLGALLPRFPSFERARGTAASDPRAAYVDPSTIAPYGIPLLQEDGSLFGVLCAFGDKFDTDRLERSRSMLVYAASMLANAVRSDFTLEETLRRADRAAAEALLDPLTSLYNRRGWDDLLNGEEQRCARHNENAAVFVVDLDNLKVVNDTFGHERGDELIRAAADALRVAVRGSDVVARIGGDEFAVLAIKCDRAAAPRVIVSMEKALEAANVQATIGYAVRSEAGSLFEAQRRADAEMYSRKGQRGTRPTNLEIQSEPVQSTSPREAEHSTLQPQGEVTMESTVQNEQSVIASVIETMLPAILAKLHPQTEAPQAAAPEVTPTPEPQAAVQPKPQATVHQQAAEPEVQPAPKSHVPSNDLIEIVSRLRTLSDGDRRLLDAFLRGGE